MRIKQRTQPPRSPGFLLTSSASDSLLACPWERCQRDYSPFLPRAPSSHQCSLPDGLGMGLGESGSGPLCCVCNMRVLVCSALGAGTLSAGVGVGVLARKQSRSLQNLPGQGGWSWVGQSGAIPGF